MKNFNELNIQGFDFTKGFNYADVHTIENLKNLFENIFDLNIYQDQNIRKHKLIPPKNTKNTSNKVVDLLIKKNHYALKKKIHKFLGNHNSKLDYRRCLRSWIRQNSLENHKKTM